MSYAIKKVSNLYIKCSSNFIKVFEIEVFFVMVEFSNRDYPEDDEIS